MTRQGEAKKVRERRTVKEHYDAKRRRQDLVKQLCEHLADTVDIDTLIDFYYEEQYRYFDKEAHRVELLEWLTHQEIITDEEAVKIETNGF